MKQTYYNNKQDSIFNAAYKVLTESNDKRMDSQFRASDDRAKIMYDPKAMMAKLQSSIDYSTEKDGIQKISYSLTDLDSKTTNKLFELVQFYLGGGSMAHNTIPIDVRKILPSLSKQETELVSKVIDGFVSGYKKYFKKQ
jgi:hypothetical protein